MSSNRFAVLVSVVALAVFAGFALWDSRFSYLGAVLGAVAVFLAWAIGRELDPDHQSVAAIASVLAIGMVFVGAPGVLVTFAALMAVRAVAGTTGYSLKWVDLIPLGIAGYASGGAVWSWSIAIILFAWLKSGPEVGRRRWWGVGVLTVGFIIGWYLGDLDPWVFTAKAGLLGLGVAAVTMLALTSASATSATDSGRSTISNERIRLARIAAGVIALLAVLVGSEDALLELGPLISALTATAVVAIATRFGIFDREPT